MDLLNARSFHALALAGLITVLTPFSLAAKVDTAKAAAAAATAPTAAQVQATTATAMAETASSPAVDTSKVSGEVRQQTQEKEALRDGLRQAPSAGGAQEAERADLNQVSVGEPVSRGALKLNPDTGGGFAYVQPYVEPNDRAHRNYCGPGAATVVISHWDPEYPAKVDIDQLGREMKLDPSSGVWIRDIVKPVNDRVNAAAGQELNWYRYGKAQSLDDFRWMLDFDARQNGAPLITGLMTRGLPGWGQENVGHIVAVYGYTRDADGKEWVTYADTAAAASGYDGPVLHTVDLGTFWNAVSENSAQVW